MRESLSRRTCLSTRARRECVVLLVQSVAFKLRIGEVERVATMCKWMTAEARA